MQMPLMAGVAILVAAGPSLSAGQRTAAIEYAKSLPVSAIEAGLPATRLDEWLRRTVAASTLHWFISGCDLMPEDLPARQVLLCVGARVSKGDPVYLRFHLAVGNFADGVSGKPYVLRQSFASCNPADSTSIDSAEQFDRLSAVAGIVGRLRKTCRRELI